MLRRSRWTRAISLKVDQWGRVTLSLPMRAPLYAARHLLEQHRAQVREALRGTSRPNKTELDELRKKAKAYLPGRLAALAAEHGFRYQKARLSSAGTRWGSCSSRGTISLNIALMRLDQELIDYVIIHELCHTRQMNHGPAFWSLVEQYCRKYKQLRRQLRNKKPRD